MVSKEKRRVRRGCQFDVTQKFYLSAFGGKNFHNSSVAIGRFSNLARLTQLKYTRFKKMYTTVMSPIFLSILAGLGGMLGWGTSDFFAGLFSKKIGHFKTFFWSQTAGLIFTALLIFFFATSFSIPTLMAALLPVAAVFYAAAYLFFYKGFEIGIFWNLSIVGILEAFAVASVNWGLTISGAILVTPIASALSIITITMALVFLKEKVTKIQALGILMAVTGIVLTAF